MAQTTDLYSFVDALIESSINGSAFTDISGFANELTVDPASRMSGEVYTADGDVPLIGAGKREPVFVNCRIVFTEGSDDPFEELLAHKVLEERTNGKTLAVGESEVPLNGPRPARPDPQPGRHGAHAGAAAGIRAGRAGGDPARLCGLGRGGRRAVGTGLSAGGLGRGLSAAGHAHPAGARSAAPGTAGAGDGRALSGASGLPG